MLIFAGNGFTIVEYSDGYSRGYKIEGTCPRELKDFLIRNPKTITAIDSTIDNKIFGVMFNNKGLDYWPPNLASRSSYPHSPDTIIQLSCGNDWIAFLYNDKKTIKLFDFKGFPLDSPQNTLPIKQFSCGDDNIISLHEKNEIRMFGLGLFSSTKLSLRTSHGVARFWKLNSPKANTIVKVCCGKGIAIALDKEGKAYFTGWCSSQFQDKHYYDNHTFRLFEYYEVRSGRSEKLPKIKDISCKGNNVLLLGENGQVFGAGENDHGQLGARKGIPDKRLALVEIEGSPTIEHIYCGRFHSILMDNRSVIYTSGRNENGGLGPRRRPKKMPYSGFLGEYFFGQTGIDVHNRVGFLNDHPEEIEIIGGKRITADIQLKNTKIKIYKVFGT